MKEVPLLRLYDKKAVELGEFAGWRTVIRFTSLRDEHHAVRNRAAIFDISHMTRTKVTGPGATTTLNKILTVDVEKLKTNRMKYGLILNESGGIIDDVTVLRLAEDSFVMVSNAVTRDKVLSWIRAYASKNVSVEDFTDSSAFFAVQGPEAFRFVSTLFGDVTRFKWFEGSLKSFDGCLVLITRSGYTGGDGFEIMIPCGGPELYGKVWNSFYEMGVKPAGLACRDVCRMEAGFPLSGHDFDESKTPYEAGLMWAVKMDKPYFIGKHALENRPQPSKVLTLVELLEPGVPRRGYKVFDGDDEVGVVSSGCLSPLIGRGIALAYLPPEYQNEGRTIYVEIHGRPRKSAVRMKPWVSLQHV